MSPAAKRWVRGKVAEGWWWLGYRERWEAGGDGRQGERQEDRMEGDIGDEAEVEMEDEVE